MSPAAITICEALEEAASREGVSGESRDLLRRVASLLRGKPYIVKVDRRLCASCRIGQHTECEPIPIEEDGPGTAYVECVCLCMPSWMERRHDSESKP